MLAPAALRMACAAWLRDPDGRLTARQRAWLQTRLALPTPFTLDEVTRLAPGLQAWAAAQHPTLGTTIAHCCGLLAPESDPQRSGLAILRAYPGPQPDEEESR
jgi:hypothetical protein